MGPETAALEQEFAAFLGSSGALAVSNCTAALHLALIACGIRPGDEVILPALSFVATANAVLYMQARPVFADIESLERPHLDPRDVERKLTPKTRAVIAMHYAGYPCAMKELAALCRARGIALVEDAAHTAGSQLDGQFCGTLGDVGCFSLFGNKNLPAGEGGFLVTRDPAKLEAAKLARSHGMTTLSWDRSRGHASSYDVVALGYNYRMPELSSAVARAQLAKLPAMNARRDAVFARYLRNLSGTPKLLIPFASAQAPGSRHLFPIILEAESLRERFAQRMKDAGIQTSLHYPPIPSFSFYGKAPSPPLTESYSRREVTLPFHPGLSDASVDEICGAVKEALS